LVDGKARGNSPLLNDQRRQALREIVESGPIPAVHGVVRWRLIDLAQWVFEEFRLSISKQTLSRELRPLGGGRRRTRESWRWSLTRRSPAGAWRRSSMTSFAGEDSGLTRSSGTTAPS
jgi:hypothetical protein